MKISANIDVNYNQLLRMRAENIGVASTTNNSQGRIISDSTTLKYYDGSAWQTLFTGTVSAATNTAEGIIQLAGDLAGNNNAAAPQLTAANTSLTSLANVTAINTSGSLRIGANNSIGAAVNTGNQLTFGGTLNTAGTDVIGLQINTSLAPQASSFNAYGSYLNPTLIAAASTVYATGAGLYIAAIAKSGTGTYTNVYGIYINTPTAGATNYALYTNGTAPSLFGGGVTISTGGLAITAGGLSVGSVTWNSGNNIDATKITGAASGLSSVTTTGDINIGGNLNITGNINETTVNNLAVTDLTIRANAGSAFGSPTLVTPTFTSGAITDGTGAGLVITRFSASAQRQDAAVLWNETTKKVIVTVLKGSAATTDAPAILPIGAVYTQNSTTANPMVVTHNLNNSFPLVMVWEGTVATLPDITVTDANTVSISFSNAPTTNQYTVTVIG